MSIRNANGNRRPKVLNFFYYNFVNNRSVNVVMSNTSPFIKIKYKSKKKIKKRKGGELKSVRQARKLCVN